MNDSELVLLGKITGTHGIRGQLRVFSYSGESATISALDSVLLKDQAGHLHSFEIEAFSLRGRKILLKFKEYNHINLVEHLVGWELYVKSEQLPELPAGEYYWRDLLGLKVVTDKGEDLGTIADIIETGSNDVYLVRSGEREYLIPALEDVVRDVDLVHRTMTVSPLEGLLDL